MIGKTVKTLSAIFNEQAYVEVMPSMTQVSQKDRFTTVESLRIIFKKTSTKEKVEKMRLFAPLLSLSTST